jgi:hypothetical protein
VATSLVRAICAEVPVMERLMMLPRPGAINQTPLLNHATPPRPIHQNNMVVPSVIGAAEN